jgi:NAD(P)H-dependent FMN reductase
MYTIIAGTNRPGSNTLKVAKEYQRLLKAKGIEAAFLSLEGINLLKRDAAFEQMENDYLIPASKFLIIAPEYNGSFPGVLKLMIDNSKISAAWWHKKALLTGVATGRAGNLRGMEHLAGVLHYLKITVLPNLLPISVVDKLLDADNQFTDEATLLAINNQLDHFISWGNL